MSSNQRIAKMNIWFLNLIKNPNS